MGRPLLVEMRKRNPDLKIIFVSGYAEDAFEKSLPENQQFNFLPKPFTLEPTCGSCEGNHDNFVMIAGLRSATESRSLYCVNPLSFRPPMPMLCACPLCRG